MNRQILYTLLLLSIIYYDSLFCQKSDECKRKLIEYVDFMESKFKDKNNKDTYHVKYSVKTHFSPELRMKPSDNITEVISAKNRLIVISDKLELYADSKNIFVVIPSNKKVYWNSYDPEVFSKMDNYKRILDVQKVLWNSAKSIDCTMNGTNEFIMVVKPSEKFSKSIKLNKQVILFDRKKNVVKNVTNMFQIDNRIRKQKVEYLILNYTSNKKIQSSKSYIFEGGKLKNQYKGYSIIDNR